MRLPPLSLSFTPRDPNYVERVTRNFHAQGLVGHLGAILVAVDPGQAFIRLPFRPELSQHHGFFHGGAIGSLADDAGGFAGDSLIAADQEVLTSEYKLNFLAPGRGASLLAHGQVIKSGRTLIITRIDVYAEPEDGSEAPPVLCAIAQQTLVVVQAQRLKG